jgi:hypothetical protein
MVIPVKWFAREQYRGTYAILYDAISLLTYSRSSNHNGQSLRQQSHSNVDVRMDEEGDQSA